MKFSDLVITNDVYYYIWYEKHYEQKFFVLQQFKEHGRFHKSYLTPAVLNLLKNKFEKSVIVYT